MVVSCNAACVDGDDIDAGDAVTSASASANNNALRAELGMHDVLVTIVGVDSMGAPVEQGTSTTVAMADGVLNTGLAP